RAYAVMSLGIGRAIPVEVGATRAPAVATVLANGDLGVAGVIGAGHRTELAALAQSEQVQCAALAGWKARTVEKDACAIDHPGLATRQFTLCKMIRMLVLDPA